MLESLVLKRSGEKWQVKSAAANFLSVILCGRWRAIAIAGNTQFGHNYYTNDESDASG